MIRWRHFIRDENGFIPMLLALLIALGGLVGVGSLMLSRSTANLRSGKANLEQLAEIEKTIGRAGVAEVLVLLGYYTSVALGMKVHEVPIPQ